MTPAALPPTITMLEDGNLAFSALQQAPDIFLMGEDHHQGDSNGEYTVDIILHVEDDENEHGKCDAGENGTKGNESG